MKLNSTVVLMIVLLSMSGCSSLPTRLAPPVAYSNVEELYQAIAIVDCEDIENEYSNHIHTNLCEIQTIEFSDALKDIGIFSEVIIGNSEKAKYKIKLKAKNKRPHQFSIGHNPGILVLSSVIPFWESYTYGYEFELISDGEKYNINTVEEGTFLMWFGSLVINLSSKRGIPGSHYESERVHLRNTILNVIGETAPNKAH